MDQSHKYFRINFVLFVLQKKNSALLTRLKRQVDEQKEKYEQIVSHTNCLMEKIESTKVKLDKITNEDISGI